MSLAHSLRCSSIQPDFQGILIVLNRQYRQYIHIHSGVTELVMNNWAISASAIKSTFHKHRYWYCAKTFNMRIVLLKRPQFNCCVFVQPVTHLSYEGTLSPTQARLNQSHSSVISHSVFHKRGRRKKDNQKFLILEM